MIDGERGKGNTKKGEGERRVRRARARERERERERERRFYARGAPKLTFSAGEKPSWIPRYLTCARSPPAVVDSRPSRCPLPTPSFPFASIARLLLDPLVYLHTLHIVVVRSASCALAVNLARARNASRACRDYVWTMLQVRIF